MSKKKANTPAVRLDSPEKPTKGVVRFLVESALAILIALVIAALLRVAVFQIFKVPSGSMEHTLDKSDRIVAVRLASFERGDVVVFEDTDAAWMGPLPASQNPIRRGLEKVYLLPDSTQGYLVKRVIGMPGDHVACCDQRGRITVNGTALDESEYLYTDAAGQQVAPSDMTFDVVVPANSLFMMGDHRDRSGDSRLHICEQSASGHNYGFVSTDAVVGPVETTVWPVTRIRGFDRPATFENIPDPSEPAPAEPRIGAGTCS